MKLIHLIKGSTPSELPTTSTPPVQPEAQPEPKAQDNGEDEARLPPGNQTVVAIVMDILTERKVEWFHTPLDQPFVTLTMHGHRETLDVRGRSFKSLLQGDFYALTGRALPCRPARRRAPGPVPGHTGGQARSRLRCRTTSASHD